MSEHQFKSIYMLGYGDAVNDRRRASRPKTALLLVAVACLAFWAGRASTRSDVDAAYEAGFDAGVEEGTIDWEEWR